MIAQDTADYSMDLLNHEIAGEKTAGNALVSVALLHAAALFLLLAQRPRHPNILSSKMNPSRISPMPLQTGVPSSSQVDTNLLCREKLASLLHPLRGETQRFRSASLRTRGFGRLFVRS